MEIKHLFIFLVSYLLGSVPFGVVFGKLLGSKDPRKAGSGNIGFTNVLRVAGIGPAVLTLLGDIGKGSLAAFLGKLYLGPEGALVSGLLSILGHCYPVFLKFQGGKAVATAFGVLAVLYPVIGLLTFGVWLVIVLWSRYVSLASLAAFGSLPLIMVWYQPQWGTILFSILTAVFIMIRHRENIRRLILKQENKAF